MAEEENANDNQESGIAPEIVDKARKFGWVPKEEFHGDVATWRDADEFVKRGDEILGFVRADRDKAFTKLASTEAKVAELESTLKEVSAFYKESEERAFKRALTELKDQKKRAIDLGDGDIAVKIDDQIEELKGQKEALDASKVKRQPASDPVKEQNQATLSAWIDKGNEIFLTDAEVVQYANKYADVVRYDPKTEHLVGEAYLEKVAEKVREALPHKFEGNSRSKVAAVGSSSDTGSAKNNSRKKSYADLPADAKKACDKYVKTMVEGKPLMTQDEYVKSYFQGE